MGLKALKATEAEEASLVTRCACLELNVQVI